MLELSEWDFKAEVIKMLQQSEILLKLKGGGGENLS